MSEILTVELKSDLENIYKLTGDLLNLISSKDFSSEKDEIRDIMGMIELRLMDIGGTLQKDIFNCDYLMTKMKTIDPPKSGISVINSYIN